MTRSNSWQKIINKLFFFAAKENRVCLEKNNLSCNIIYTIFAVNSEVFWCSKNLLFLIIVVAKF